MPSILYLDASPSRSIKKALARHGEVRHAGGITDALYLIAERDYEYYFIDADISESRALVHHIRHDPQLAPPLGIVLMTRNVEEDCDAWRVDTFINRERFADEVPYVFSHLKGNDDAPANVFRIVPPAVVEKDERVTGPRPGPSETPLPRPRAAGREGPRKPRPGKEGDRYSPTGDRADFAGSSRGTILKVSAAVILAGALAFWLVNWGPLAKKDGGRKDKAKVSKSVEAGSRDGTAPGSGGRGSFIDYEQSPLPPSSTQPAAAPSTVSPGPSGEAQPNRAVEQEAAPAPAPAANSAPAASIDGPDQLLRGQSAVFTASGHDPDGDPVTLSWTSRTMNWSVPGCYSLSVTVTDGRGASSTAVKNVRVI